MHYTDQQPTRSVASTARVIAIAPPNGQPLDSMMIG